jgi:hypothetical protein
MDKVSLWLNIRVARTLILSSTSRLSINFIRHILRITQVPEFVSYSWYLRSNDTTVQQATLLILTHLKRKPTRQDLQIVLTLVDEIIDFYGSADELDPQHKSEQDQKPSIWQILKKMRMDFDTPNKQDSAALDKNLFGNSSSVFMSEDSSNSPIAASASTSTTNFQQTSQWSSSQPSTYLDLSPLEYWSSVMLRESEDHSMTEIS